MMYRAYHVTRRGCREQLTDLEHISHQGQRSDRVTIAVTSYQ